MEELSLSLKSFGGYEIGGVTVATLIFADDLVTVDEHFDNSKLKADAIMKHCKQWEGLFIGAANNILTIHKD